MILEQSVPGNDARRFKWNMIVDISEALQLKRSAHSSLFSATTSETIDKHVEIPLEEKG